MWNIEDPDNFDNFTPADMPAFLNYWERETAEAMSLQFMSAFVDGIAQPWLELIAQRGNAPIWVQNILRWRLSAQWAYQQAIPLSSRLERGMVPLKVEGMPTEFKVTPKEIAEVPPAVRQAFIEGNRFSMKWVKNLSGDARSLMGDLLSVNRLQGRNPLDAVPLLEQILRRESVSKLIREAPENLTPEQIRGWTEQAEFKTLEAIARRAKLIAQTESMRMMNLGILTTLEERGMFQCYVMPHRGSCPDCQRLIDGRVFKTKTLRDNLFANFGMKPEQWKPALPQHPGCLHSPMEVPVFFEDAIARIKKLPDEGVLLQWYGLPGGEQAFESLGMPRLPWMNQQGAIV